MIKLHGCRLSKLLELLFKKGETKPLLQRCKESYGGFMGVICPGMYCPVTLPFAQCHSHDDFIKRSGHLSISCIHNIFVILVCMIKVQYNGLETCQRKILKSMRN